MGTQRSTGQFRNVGAPNFQNFSDSSAGPSGWSPGVTLIDPVPLQPALTERWNIVGFSVQARLAVNMQQAAGLLGRLFASLVIDSGPTNGPVQPMSGLPQDTTMAVDLWDGSTGRVPPSWNSAAGPVGATLPVNAALNLTQPIPLQTGTIVGIGLWLTPSLPATGSAVGVAVFQASYSLIYDDGLPPQPVGWGGP